MRLRRRAGPNNSNFRLALPTSPASPRLLAPRAWRGFQPRLLSAAPSRPTCGSTDSETSQCSLLITQRHASISLETRTSLCPPF